LKPFGTYCRLLAWTVQGTVAAAMTAHRSSVERVGSLTDERFRRVRHDVYTLAFETWFAALPESEQRRMKEIGIEKPVVEQFGPVRPREEEEDFEREIADGELPVMLEADGREIQAAVTRAMYWCLEARSLVEIGQRWLLVMTIWRSPLIAGVQMEFERELMDAAAREVGDDDGGSGHVMEWVRRAGKVSQIGQRVMVAAYVLAPAIIGSASLEVIGRLNNKTRQAVNKVVQDFRDSFGGIKNRAMRDDSTRLLCKIAQLEDHYGDERRPAGAHR
jgi:hypothetical protein